MSESLHDEVIRLENVSVRYRTPQERIGTFKEYAIRWLQGRLRMLDFWALHDVSFSVQRGEVFGLIGQNGAGKSTLLKLVARVLRPTLGRVWVRGRVAPLLEVGAGFHPELTGRENVMLNGVLLGFTRAQMKEKFDRIVDFAGLWDFIDAPLRTYSSGMSARLGFAVATDSEPDILIVDEVLSVGDEAFQRKSAERIDAFRRNGATIFLVSHNLGQVEQMCQRAALLDHGRVLAVGSPRAVVDLYLENIRKGDAAPSVAQDPGMTANRWGTGRVCITRVRLLDQDGVEQANFHTGQRLTVELSYTARQPTPSPVFGVAIHRQDGVHVTGPNTGAAGLRIELVAGGGVVTYTVPGLSLLEGRYLFSAAVHSADDREMYDYHDKTYSFRVDNRGWEVAERYGLATMHGEWRHHASADLESANRPS
ncbi:MAG: ABC transporter ATP-binding protein [Chloroflexi bacterium]|nr:ABC transporter ATP-binding protein [Chloroflexota bacterium]